MKLLETLLPLQMLAHKSLCFSVPENGDEPLELDVYDFKGPGVALAMYNVDEVCPSSDLPAN